MKLSWLKDRLLFDYVPQSTRAVGSLLMGGEVVQEDSVPLIRKCRLPFEKYHLEKAGMAYA